MTKGFYQLTSGMLSQSRRLDVVANNMTNVATPGYKSELYTDSTFEEVMYSLVGNKDKRVYTPIGEQSYLLAPSQLYVDYDQGTLEETGLNLDFAIQGEGFFAVQTDNGVAYTRGGSFSLDDEGYLCLSGHGRVLGVDSQPIYLNSDLIRCDGYGGIYTQEGGYLGRIGVFAFVDNTQLAIGADGLFDAGGQAPQAADTPVIWKSVERSNVDLVGEMSRMITTQRAFQSAAQVLKIYDELLTRAVTDVGSM